MSFLYSYLVSDRRLARFRQVSRGTMSGEPGGGTRRGGKRCTGGVDQTGLANGIFHKLGIFLGTCGFLENWKMDGEKWKNGFWILETGIADFWKLDCAVVTLLCVPIYEHVFLPPYRTSRIHVLRSVLRRRRSF